MSTFEGLSLIIIMGLLALMIAVAVTDFRQRRPNSLLIMGPLLALEYFLRPIFVFREKTVGWDFANLVGLEYLRHSYAIALQNSGLLILLIFVSYTAVRLTPGRPAASVAKMRPFGDAPRVSTSPAVLRFKRASTVLLGVSLYLALSLADGGTAFAGTQGRQNFGSGLQYLALNLCLVAVLGFVATTTAAGLPIQRYLLLLSFVFVGLHLSLTGSRVESVTLIIGLLVVGVYRSNEVNWKRVGLIVGATALALAWYRVGTREVHYDRTISGDLQVSNDLSDPLGLVVRGDVSSFDKLLVIDNWNLASASNTYLAIVDSAVPGRASKPGGNMEFTRLADPVRHARGITFEGVSYFGEALMNGGWFAVAFAAIALGASLAGLDRWALKRSPSGVFAWILVQGSLPSLLRADALNYASLYGPMMVVGLLATNAVTVRASSSSVNSGHRS